MVLIGITLGHCAKNTSVVQLADDLGCLHRPNYLFMMRFIDIICGKVRYQGEKLPQNSRTVFIVGGLWSVF